MMFLSISNSSEKAVVDEDVYEWASRIEWHLDKKGYVHSGHKRLHRMILGLSGRANQGDHRNLDKLNNLRENLRPATHAQNLWNADKKSHNKSGFKGVYLCGFTGRYRAEIRVNNCVFKIGRFGTPEEAARAYDKAAVKYHGEFARLNFR